MRGGARWPAEMACLVAALAILGGIFGAPAAAHHTGAVSPMGRSVSETISLPANNWTAYRTRLTSASERVVYDLQVIQGSAIDLYILPENGLAMYRQDPVYAFYSYDARENASVIQGSWRRVQGVDVYFVVDNVDIRGAMPTGPVTVRVSLTQEFESTVPDWFWFVCAALAAAVIAVPTALYLRQRKRRAMVRAVPPPPPAPPTGPAGQMPPPPPPPSDG